MDKYAKVKPLGKGSFGAALLIKRREDGMLFVVKEVNLSKMSHKEREEARNEVRVLQKLSHPNIVKYVEHFEKSGTLYIVMEYADGGDLHHKIKNQRNVRMKEEQIMHFFAQLCLAMEYLHSRHILHRDIKTMNIFLTSNGTVKLGDFGISTILRNTMGMANTVCGTPYYFSPELCKNKPYNNRSDVWAIGVVLYEMAMLKHPFDGNSMNQLMQRIVRSSYPPIPSSYSKTMRDLLASCLKKDPKARPNIRQLLCLDIVRDSLGRLEQNLMMATQARVRLQNVVAEEEEYIQQQKEKAAEKERLRQENQVKHAELQKKLAAMGAPGHRALGHGPQPVIPRKAVPNPAAIGQRKPALPSAAVGGVKKQQPAQQQRYGYGVGGGHGGGAYGKPAAAKPTPQPSAMPRAKDNPVYVHQKLDNIQNHEAMRPIEDFIAQLDQPIEKRIGEVMERQKAEKAQRDREEFEAAQAKALKLQKEKELAAMLKLREEQMKRVASKQKAPSSNVGVDPRPRKDPVPVQQKPIAGRRAVGGGAAGAVLGGPGAKKAPGVRKISPQPVQRQQVEKQQPKTGRRATDAPKPLSGDNAKIINPNLMPQQQQKAGSDPVKVQRVQAWQERQNEEKKRKMENRNKVLDEERKAVAAMDEQVFRGMQNRVVDPALEAWVAKEMKKGNLDQPSSGAPAAVAAPSKAQMDVYHGGGGGGGGAAVPKSAAQVAAQKYMISSPIDQAPPVLAPPPQPKPSGANPRDELPAAVHHRRAMGMDEPTKSGELQAVLSSADNSATAGATGTSASSQHSAEVQKSVDQVDILFRQHGVGLGGPSLATPNKHGRQRRSRSTDVNAMIEEEIPEEFRNAPLLQHSPLYLKNKGTGAPVRGMPGSVGSMDALDLPTPTNAPDIVFEVPSSSSGQISTSESSPVDQLAPQPPKLASPNDENPRTELWVRRGQQPGQQLAPNNVAPSLNVVNLSGNDQPERARDAAGVGAKPKKQRDRSAPPIMRTPVKEEGMRPFKRRQPGGGGAHGNAAGSEPVSSADDDVVITAPEEIDAVEVDDDIEDITLDENPKWITPSPSAAAAGGRDAVPEILLNSGEKPIPEQEEKLTANNADVGKISQPVDVKQRNAEYQTMMSHIHNILASPVSQSTMKPEDAAQVQQLRAAAERNNYLKHDGDGAAAPPVGAPPATSGDLEEDPSITEDIVDTTQDDFEDEVPMTPNFARGPNLDVDRKAGAGGGGLASSSEVDEDVLFRLAHLCGEGFTGSQPVHRDGTALFGAGGSNSNVAGGGRKLQGLERAEALRQHLETSLGIDVFASAYNTLVQVGAVGSDDANEQLCVDTVKELIAETIREDQLQQSEDDEMAGDEDDDGGFIKRSAEMHHAVLDENAIEERSEEFLALICQLIFFDEEGNSKQYVQVKRFL